MCHLQRQPSSALGQEAAARILLLGPHTIPLERFQADLFQHVNLCLFISTQPYVFGKMDRKPDGNLMFLMEAISETKSSRLGDFLSSVVNHRDAGGGRCSAALLRGTLAAVHQAGSKCLRALKT